MLYQLDVDDVLRIGSETYHVAEHPTAPGIADGQEGRTAIVYRLLNTRNGRSMALKTFIKPEYRTPAIVKVSHNLAPISSFPGLEACERTVITAQAHASLLKNYPDFIYAVLMPWIEGRSWFDILHNKEEIGIEQSLDLVRSFLHTLVRMEEKGLAHCDLSSANILLPGLEKNGKKTALISFVDVEQMYGPGFDRPELPGASPGYAHSTAITDYWKPEADRFAGAILIAEMLGWCFQPIREAAYGESYFAPGETHGANRSASDNYKLIRSVLEQNWGNDISTLFQRAWHCESLQQCPTFAEWLLALPEDSEQHQVETKSLNPFEASTVEVLMELAQSFENEGRFDSASALWQQAYELVDNAGLRNIIDLKLRTLDNQPIPKAHIEHNGESSVLPTQTPSEEDFPVRDVSIPSSGASRQRMIVGFFSIFLILAILTIVFFIAQESTLNRLMADSREVTGVVGEQVIASASLALVIGIVQAFIFRRTVRGINRLLFVLITTVSGAVGGLLGGMIMKWLNIPLNAINGFFIGALIGGTAGALASFGQNLFLRDQGSGFRWFLWNTFSWLMIWGIGWQISWLSGTTIIDNAIGAAFMILALGATLSFLLHISPSIEF